MYFSSARWYQLGGYVALSWIQLPIRYDLVPDLTNPNTDNAYYPLGIFEPIKSDVFKASSQPMVFA